MGEQVIFMTMLSIQTTQINLYLSALIFFFGVIGNLLNIFVLTHRSIRSNSCIFLFLISSIANLISIVSGLISRILSTWQLDFTEIYDVPCKLRAFITFTSRSTALWLIMLATMDRWMISSSEIHRRKLSSLKTAQKGSILITIISISFYLHMLYCYQANLSKTPLKCYGKTSMCRLTTDLTYACFTIILPIVLMTGFGVQTIFNVREAQTAIKISEISSEKSATREPLTVSQQKQQRWRKLENYLRRMLFIQVILLIVLTLPQAIHKIFYSITSNENKSALAYDFDRFLYQFELLLPFIQSGLPFYINTLAGGKIFRKTLYKLMRCPK